MSDESIRPGQVSATPEGGPVAEGVPGREPGSGQVRSTPEAAPLSEGEELTPPTWQEHMRGPILGSDGRPLGQGQGPEATAPAPEPAAAREEEGVMSAASTRTDAHLLVASDSQEPADGGQVRVYSNRLSQGDPDGDDGRLARPGHARQPIAS